MKKVYIHKESLLVVCWLFVGCLFVVCCLLVVCCVVCLLVVGCWLPFAWENHFRIRFPILTHDNFIQHPSRPGAGSVVSDADLFHGT